MSLNQEKTIAEILPGFYLVEGVWNGETTLGIGRGNHPDILFKKEELKAPLSKLSDNYEDDSKYFMAVEKLEKKLVFEPMYGYDLIKAAKKSGYRPERHGRRFAAWFMDKIFLTLNPEYVEKMNLDKIINEGQNKSSKKLKV